jgi:hypothetical protein
MRKAARARFEEYFRFDFDAAWTSLAQAISPHK